jgi:rubredoxin
MRNVTNGNWSKRIGLASINDNAILAYKRSVDCGTGSGYQTELFLDNFTLNYRTGNLESKSKNPSIVPLTQLGFNRPGFWTHTFTQNLPTPRIFILLQAIKIGIPYVPFEGYPKLDDPQFKESFYNSGITNLELYKYMSGEASQLKYLGLYKIEPYEESHLILLSADFSDPKVDLSINSNWEVKDFGIGGWDLDAIADGNILACVHRKSPFAIESIVDAKFLLGDNQQRHFPLSTNIFSDAEYPNLELIKINILAVPMETARIELPGGADPMIQSLTPLVITVDRVLVGEIRINPPQPETHMGPFTFPARPPSANLIVSLWSKVLFRKNLNQWERGEIDTMNNNLFPQNLAEMYCTEPLVTQLNFSTSPNKAFATTLDTLAPTFIPEYTITSKYDQLALMRHRAVEGSLRLDWIRLYPENLDLNIEGIPAFSILDINHSHIPSDLTPDGYAENNQFGILSYGEEIRDTTIGGALVTERPIVHLTFYAYTDMGDRGLRVIYNDLLPDPVPIPGEIDKNGLDPANVTGPTSTTDLWFDIPSSGWTQVELPPYDVTRDFFGSDDSFLTDNKPYPGALSSGLMPLLDTISCLLPILNAPGGTDINFDLVRNSLQPIIDIAGASIDIWQSIWAPFDSANSEKYKCPHCGFIYDSASGYPVSGIAPGTRFNDLPDNWVCPTCGTAKDDFESESRFSYLIPELNLEIDNYRIEYHTIVNNDSLTKDFVRILNLGKHRIEYQCVENLVGQGSIELSFKVGVASNTIVINGILGKIASIDDMSATLSYNRLYTPAILMSEKRSQNVMTGEIEYPPYELINQWNDMHNPPPVATTYSSILSMKPIFNASFRSVLDVLNVNVNVWAVSIVVLIDILIAIGLSFLASPLAGIATIVGLLTVEGMLVYTIKNVIYNEVLDGLSSDNIRKSLNDLNLHRYAGEGLADNMAALALTKAGLPIDLGLQLGRNRFREQLWQMAFVTKDLFRVMLRK